MSDSVQPHRLQPTRLPHPWDSPGKNTGVGCHFLLQCIKVKSESEVAQSCPTPSDPMDCSLPGSSAHGIFQERVLEWGAIAFSIQISRTMVLNIKKIVLEMLELCKKKERIGRIERDVINILPFLGAEDILSLESHPFPGNLLHPLMLSSLHLH